MEGTQITAVREMSDEEYRLLYWHVDNIGRARVIELSDGSVLIPSMDPEGNGAGFFDGLPVDSEDVVGETIEAVTPDNAFPNVSAHRPVPPKIELSNGSTIVPLRDAEGNGPGTLFQLVGGKVYQIHFESN